MDMTQQVGGTSASKMEGKDRAEESEKKWELDTLKRKCDRMEETIDRFGTSLDTYNHGMVKFAERAAEQSEVMKKLMEMITDLQDRSGGNNPTSEARRQAHSQEPVGFEEVTFPGTTGAGGPGDVRGVRPELDGDDQGTPRFGSSQIRPTADIDSTYRTRRDDIPRVNAQPQQQRPIPSLSRALSRFSSLMPTPTERTTVKRKVFESFNEFLE